jgi:thioredoxin 1
MSQKFQEIINSERPVLIDFFATWCQPCKVQSSVLNTVKENIGEGARIIKVDVDQYLPWQHHTECGEFLL